MNMSVNCKSEWNINTFTAYKGHIPASLITFLDEVIKTYYVGKEIVVLKISLCLYFSKQKIEGVL